MTRRACGRKKLERMRFERRSPEEQRVSYLGSMRPLGKAWGTEFPPHYGLAREVLDRSWQGEGLDPLFLHPTHTLLFCPQALAAIRSVCS